MLADYTTTATAASTATVGARARDVPVGMRVVQTLPECGGSSQKMRLRRHLATVLIITWLVYAGCHLVRMSFSVVKSTLNPKVTASNPNGGWAPFNDGPADKDGVRQYGKELLGDLDTAFLLAYAICMFFMGQVADRSNLRIFMSITLLGNAMLSILLGMAYFWNIHEMWYFVFVQFTLGVYQSTGWPCVLGVVGKWVNKDNRGLLMGIWNSHTSIGNILGAVIPAAVLSYGWGWCLIVPGFIMASIALLVFFFLVVYPQDVGLPDPLAEDKSAAHALQALYEEEASENAMSTALLSTGNESPTIKPQNYSAIRFVDALKIPGVVIFALTLFFSKLVAYTFLFWLPYYVKHTTIGGQTLSASVSAYFSTIFDVGGIVGGIVAGALCDYTQKPAVVNCVTLFLTIPVLFLYRSVGSASYGLNVTFLLFSGFFVNAPYALITTAVSAELGTHKSLHGNPKALATVTAIIDGTGSIGAALGPFLAGAIPDWTNTFYMLMSSCFIAGSLLVYHSLKELGWLKKSSAKVYTKLVNQNGVDYNNSNDSNLNSSMLPSSSRTMQLSELKNSGKYDRSEKINVLSSSRRQSNHDDDGVHLMDDSEA